MLYWFLLWLQIMWPIIAQAIRGYMPYVALPFAALVGFVGFNLESKFRNSDRLSSSSNTPKQTFEEKRLERHLQENPSESNLPQFEELLSSPTLKYRGDPMFDKNK